MLSSLGWWAKVMLSSPFFVIRNSRHSSSADNEVIAGDQLEASESVADCASTDVLGGGDVNVALVRLVETQENGYRLDFCDAENSFLSDFLLTNTWSEQDGDDGAMYVDGKAWRHLQVYGDLLRTPIATKNDVELRPDRQGSFVLLEDDLKEIVHTLLPIETLFSWQLLVEARAEGTLTWKDIRAFLSLSRANVPFLTRDGVLKHAVNVHLTFPQFVAFARLVELHLSAPSEPDVAVVDINISDVFQPFDTMTPEEQLVELLASVKDKAVRTEAQALGLAIPTNADDLVSATECSEEWSLYIQWWSVQDEVRNAFCMRELRFAENNPKVRRRAQKDGVSMRGRHSKDPLLREHFLRRFAAWYLDIESAADESDATEDGGLEEEAKTSKATTVYTYDFATCENEVDHPTGLQNFSAPQLESFCNKTWQPESEAGDPGTTELGDNQDSIVALYRAILISSAGNAAEDSRSPLTAAPHANSPLSRDNTPETSDETTQLPDSPESDTSVGYDTREPAMPDAPPVEEDPLSKRRAFGTMAATLLVASKMNIRRKKNPFRREFLRRLTTDLDKVASMFNKKEGSKLRGIALFRSKVRLVIMLQKFSLGKSLKGLGSADNVDIFKLESAPVPASKPQKPESPKEKPDNRASKEMLARAKAHREHALRKMCFQAIARWTRTSLLEKQRKREREEQLREKERQMHEQAVAAHQRSLQSRFFRALRAHAAQQKAEREKEAEPVADEVKEEPRRPSTVEKEYMSPEDVRALNFRSDCRNLVLDSTLFDELNCMPLPVGRARPSGLDVLDRHEYTQQFATAVELRSAPTPRPPSSRLPLLDEATLRRMRREHRAGKANLYTVPREFVDPPLAEVGHRGAYRARGQVRSLLAQRG